MTKIALVVLDTLRSDVFNNHFDWLPGRRYESAWAPSHWTVPVHGSLFTGLYPSEHGSIAGSKSFNYPKETLVERLSAAGFKTRAFSANPLVSPAFNFNRGFDIFSGPADNLFLKDEIFDFGTFIKKHGDSGFRRFPLAAINCFADDSNTIQSLKIGIQMLYQDIVDDDSGISQAQRWASHQWGNDDQFFYFNLMEAHAPYDRIPDEYVDESSPSEIGLKQHFEGADKESIRCAYNNAVSYLSDSYEQLFTLLQENVDYIITLGDHGELLGEHDHYGHEYGLFPELTHVPLVISGDSIKNKTVSKPVSLLDVHASILNWANINYDHSRGVPLTEVPQNQKYLIESHGLPNERIKKFEQQGYDIGPFNNYIQGIRTETGLGYQTAEGWVTEVVENGEANDLRQSLEQLLEDIPVGSSNESRNEVSDSVRERLKANGYA